MEFINALIEWFVSLFTKKEPPIILPPNPPVDNTVEQQLLLAHNQVRTEHGLSPLSLNDKLTAMAVKRANRMAYLHVLSHAGFDIDLHESGYNYSSAGENIAEGQTSVQEVVNDWMSDWGHKHNILGNYRDAGFARSGNYWVSDFGRPQ